MGDLSFDLTGIPSALWIARKGMESGFVGLAMPEFRYIKISTISLHRPNRAAIEGDSQVIPKGKRPEGQRRETWSKTMIKTFLNSESGAVTVDWVVLTAAIVGLGLAVMAVVSAGVEDLSGDIQTQLETGHITTSFGD
jgi:Flp pilus assembly pilin Flp